MINRLLEKIRNNYRFAAFVSAAVLVGGSIFSSSTFARSRGTQELTIVRKQSGMQNQKRVVRKVAPAAYIPAAVNRVALEAPPSHVAAAPSRASGNMVASINPSAQIVVNSRPNTYSHAANVAGSRHPGMAQRSRNNAVVQPQQARKASVAAQSRRAPAQKVSAGNLFSMVRLLNYSPHPLNEQLLKDKPLVLNGRQYWFNLRYDEDWHVINDDEGYMRGISFEIDVMEGNRIVRRMKTPKVAINAANISKGQVLGIAEVAPYKFTISVEEFTRNRKGISELIFKLDLVG